MNHKRISLSVVLPLPDQLLNPNSRAHWARRRRAVSEARRDASWATYSELGRTRLPTGVRRVNLSVRVPEEGHRRMDDDNLLAALKAARDGIADGLGVNDSLMRWHPPTQDGDVVTWVPESGAHLTINVDVLYD